MANPGPTSASSWAVTSATPARSTGAVSPDSWACTRCQISSTARTDRSTCSWSCRPAGRRTASAAGRSHARPSRAAGRGDQRVGGGGDAVVQQRGHRAVRVAGERELGRVVQVALHLPGRRGGVQQQQPAQPAPHGRVTLGRGREHPDVHALAAVDQPGVAGDHVPAAADPVLAGQRADRPGGQAGAFQVLPGRRELGAHLRGQLPAQRVQVGAGGQLGAVLVDHPEGHREVLGQPVQLPGLARDVHAAHPAQLPLQPVQQRLPGVGAAGLSVASTARAWSGAGANCRRSALGRVLISAVTSSSRSPGTCQVNGVGSTWCSAATGTSTVTPSLRWPGLERVVQRQREPARGHVVGVGGPVDGVGLRGAQHLLGEVEQRPAAAARCASTSCRNAARTPPRPGSAARRRRPGSRSSTTRSRRRARCSSSSTSASSSRLAWKNRCRVSQSPSTSACRMNSSRDSSASIRP